MGEYSDNTGNEIKATAVRNPTGSFWSDADTLSRRFVKWILIFGGWTLLGLFFASRYVLYSAVGTDSSPWWATFLPPLADWYLWALLTPFIFRFHRRFPLNRDKSVGRIFIHSALALGFSLVQVALYTVAMWLMQSVFGEPQSLGEMTQRILLNKFHFSLLTYVLIVLAGYSLDYYRKYRQGQVQAVEMQKQVAEAKLQTLRSQLQPHFLFNTLNSISSLVRSDEKKAAVVMLAELGDLLRSTLENDSIQEIPLRQEIGLTEKYLKIQQQRFGERLVLRMRIEPETLEARVPNFILQPLIENAINHGIAPRASGGSLKIETRRENGSLKIEVSDDGKGLPDNWNISNGAGIGLSNTQARLRLLYGGEQDFTIQNAKDGGAVISIKIPWRTEKNYTNY